MKFLIYSACFLVVAIIQVTVSNAGFSLGIIPNMLLYGVACFGAGKLSNHFCSKSSAKKQQSKQGSTTPAKSSNPTSSAFKILLCIAAFLLVALICVCIWIASKNTPPREESPQVKSTIPFTPARATIEPTQSLVALPEPDNGKLFIVPTAARVAPLTIDTAGSGGYYFILEPLGYEYTKMSFYAHANSVVNIDVPIGRYEIYYATGDIWYGVKDLFGPNTAYYKCDDIFEFVVDGNEYLGWTIQLEETPYGNLDSDTVDAEEFPN